MITGNTRSQTCSLLWCLYSKKSTGMFVELWDFSWFFISKNSYQNNEESSRPQVFHTALTKTHTKTPGRGFSKLQTIASLVPLHCRCFPVNFTRLFMVAFNRTPENGCFCRNKDHLDY